MHSRFNVADGDFAMHACDEDLQLHSATLFQLGAVIVREGREPQLVGDLRWLDVNRIAWFPAFGDRAADAREFSFADAVANADHIVFRETRGTVMLLSEIGAAPVDDRDDYSVAWLIWQQVVPLRRALIERAYHQFGPRDQDGRQHRG